MDGVVVADVTGKYQLGTLFVSFCNVSFQCRPMAGFVIASVAFVEFYFIMYCLNVSVQSVSVESLVFTPVDNVLFKEIWRIGQYL